MKKQILKVLREAGQDFVSGQSLCTTLGVSRQAVWKNIGQLKEAGYEIESVSNKGYRLLSGPKELYGPEIESYLSEDSICKKIVFFEEIDSTNTYCKQMAEQGEAEGCLVVAEKQTNGRGRRGRGWDSESGVGIWMTMILRPQISPLKVPGITLLTAIAVGKAIEDVCGVKPQIKWPNDLVLGGKKICGILTEMSSEMNYVNYVVTGIGINGNTKSFPEELQDSATSLFLELGQEVNRGEIIGRFANIFGDYYQEYIKYENLSTLVELYNSMLASKDKEVLIYHGMIEDAKPEEIEQGIARGIDESGALLVEVDGQMKRIMSGEVSVRGVYGYV